MTTTENAAALRQRFKLRFGLTAPVTKETDRIHVGGESTVFSLSFVGSRKDIMWIAMNTDTIVGSDADTGGNIAFSMENMAVCAALATRAIDGVPLWQWLGLNLPEGDKARISDPLFPPEDIHKRAALVWLNDYMLPGDDSLASFVYRQYTRLFEDQITPTRVEGANPPVTLTCQAEEEKCGYEVTLRLPKEEALTLGFCPKCGEVVANSLHEGKVAAPLE